MSPAGARGKTPAARRHPLEHVVHLKVQTTSRKTTPVDVVGSAIDELQGEVEALTQQFRNSVDQYREDEKTQAAAAAS